MFWERPFPWCVMEGLLMIQSWLCDTHGVSLWQRGWQRRLHTPLTCWHFSPRCARHDHGGWLEQEVISATTCRTTNISEPPVGCLHCHPKVDVYILHALKYNIVHALLHLYVIRGAVTRGRIFSGREELRVHVHSVRACKSRVRQKNLSGRESVDLGNNFFKSAACQ